MKTPTVMLRTWYSPTKRKMNHKTILNETFDWITSQQVTLPFNILTLRAGPRNRNKGQAAGQPTGQVQAWPSPHSFKPASQNRKHKRRQGETKCVWKKHSCPERWVSWDNRERGIRTPQKQALTLTVQIFSQWS